ncbi:COV 1-like protein [Tanacetum coccineum]
MGGLEKELSGVELFEVVEWVGGCVVSRALGVEGCMGADWGGRRREWGGRKEGMEGGGVVAGECGGGVGGAGGVADMGFRGLGFITSIMVGVFMSSWLGASVLSLGEWFIKRMPFVRHIYNASKQISSAISPDQNTQAFKEVAIIRHPRIGEYAFGFITSSVILQTYSGEEELYSVYVPTNHLYIGDIFLVNSKDVIRPNLSVREGIGK